MSISVLRVFSRFSSAKVRSFSHSPAPKTLPRTCQVCTMRPMPLPRSLTCTSCKHTYPEGWLRCPYCGYDAVRLKRDQKIERALAKKFPSYAAATGSAGGSKKKQPSRRDRGPDQSGADARRPQADGTVDGDRKRSRRRRGRRRRSGAAVQNTGSTPSTPGSSSAPPRQSTPSRPSGGTDKPPQREQNDASPPASGGEAPKRARRRRPRRRRKPAGGDAPTPKSDS